MTAILSNGKLYLHHIRALVRPLVDHRENTIRMNMFGLMKAVVIIEVAGTTVKDISANAIGKGIVTITETGMAETDQTDDKAHMKMCKSESVQNL